MPSARDSISVILGGRCNLSCTVCDCRESPASTGPDGVPALVLEGGGRLTLRGEAGIDAAFVRTLDAAARARWSEVWVRTNGQRFATAEAAAALRDRGVRGVIVPVFSHVAKVHDAVAGRPGALVTALRAMRSLAEAGLSISIESPVLSPRLQDPEALLRLAHRAVPALAGARFYVPTATQPRALAPPPWDEARPGLSRAYAACVALGVPAEIREYDAVPFCAVGHEPEREALYKFNPKKPVRRREGFALAPVCATCAAKSHCLGPNTAYTAANGERGLVPFAQRPRRMFEQRTTPRREWSADHREAASQARVRVLRPTIHCNQDCPFCSANETSDNLLPGRDDMLRRIARVARAGVRRLSFGGGEPTLSKDLVHYVRAATRLGVSEIELVTNGTLIDSPEKVRPLREAGLNFAFVSLHAHDELISRRMTAKVGDWEKTVRAVSALVDAGVATDVNHVINAVNYPYLRRFAEFVSDRWHGKVGISFAFVTPQFRALENAGLVPRISDVMPFLRRAMKLLESRRERFTVGSRQGIPPCFLGEYQGWSDVIALSANALSEDQPQKIRGPRCDECRFTAHCVGVWKSYASRFGLDELVPVAGPAFTDEEITEIKRIHGGWVPPVRFEDMPAVLRAPARDEPDVDPPMPAQEPAHRPRTRLPVVRSDATRALRIALLGSGSQARRIAAAMAHVRGIDLVGVSSPHILERDAGPFAGVRLEPDAAALIDAVKPDAVIVAAATPAHHALARLAIDRGIPVLVEKPVAQSREQAEDLVRAADAGAFVMAAHNMAFSPGVRALREESAAPDFGRVRRVVCTRRAPAQSPDAPGAWSKTALYQTLYHSAYLLGAAAGSCAARVVRVEARGDQRPEWVLVELACAGGARGEIVLDFNAPVSTAELVAEGEGGRKIAWRRDGVEETIVRDTPGGDRAHTAERGSDTGGMLEALRDAVLGKSPAPATARDGMEAMAVAQAIIEALAVHLVRPGAPKHVSSPALR